MYGNKHSQFGNKRSGFGKKISEEAMTSVALKQATGWLKVLMDSEFRGRGDRDYMIRARLADDTGIPESYLYRLQHKTREMKDIAGEYYRRLMVHHDRWVEMNNQAADRYKAKRQELSNETTSKKPASAGMAVHAPGAGALDQAEA